MEGDDYGPGDNIGACYAEAVSNYMPRPCEDCHGQKRVTVQCRTCYGRGYRRKLFMKRTCVRCRGAGHRRKVCHTCNGAGEHPPLRRAKS